MGKKKKHKAERHSHLVFHPLIRDLTQAADALAPFVEMAREKGIVLKESVFNQHDLLVSYAEHEAVDACVLAFFAQIEKRGTEERFDVRFGLRLSYREEGLRNGFHRYLLAIELSRLASSEKWELECDSLSEESRRQIEHIEHSILRIGAVSGKTRRLTTPEARKAGRRILEHFEELTLIPRHARLELPRSSVAFPLIRP